MKICKPLSLQIRFVNLQFAQICQTRKLSFSRQKRFRFLYFPRTLWKDISGFFCFTRSKPPNSVIYMQSFSLSFSISVLLTPFSSFLSFQWFLLPYSLLFLLTTISLSSLFWWHKRAYITISLWKIGVPLRKRL